MPAVAETQESTENEDEWPKPSGRDWAYLLLILAVGTGYNWQKFGLAYAYGFHGVGEQAGNPIFEIGAAYPDLAENYRFLSGLAVLLPTAILGLFMGKITDNTNRV